MQQHHPTVVIEQRQWIRDKCWKELVRKMPIPCVDVIVYRDNELLMGWRSISPYRNVWALIGGRILRGESFEAAAARHCMKSGISVADFRLVGVFPVVFRTRHDIVICVSAKMISGTPKPTKEMGKFKWFKRNRLSRASRVGANYTKMLRQWLFIGAQTQ